MEGVTHPDFRSLMADQGGLHLLCTEFVRITKNPLKASQLRGEVLVHPSCPLSVQVMGNEVERMAEAAAILCEAGAAVVDINLGCPMPRVVRKGVGAAMLKDPVLLGRVLARMRSHTPTLLSAKIRAGFDDADHVLEIARVVEDSGVDFIAVHPRRRCDFYAGVADWRIIASLKQHLSIPVIGNGDVWYAADALRMQRETGCDAVMIGRPAIRNPWIFRQIAELRAGSDAYRPDGPAVFRYIQLVAERYGRVLTHKKRGAIGPLKELLSWISRAVNDEREFHRQVLRLQSVSEILEHCERTLLPLTAEQIDLGPHGELQLERSGSALHAVGDREQPTAEPVALAPNTAPLSAVTTVTAARTPSSQCW
ncbi:MAG: hypothetical protein RJA70_1658 [Pseudomonadota bacterium]|jgi:nifR3 family TIM-barrel protein